MSWVFDTLAWKGETGLHVPALADSWKYDPDKKAFIFKLNPKATWHDGQPGDGCRCGLHHRTISKNTPMAG
jgi:ABC-type transport system substrate-binding protein